ncbi:MAG: glutamate--tRNA ligase [Patescibacteria group bacterium]
MIRTRMAPSPTGLLHVGTAHTALFNYLFTRHHGGVFVLRIEDTDIERSRKEFEDDILEHLTWLGIAWDEFYRQSDRLQLYKTYLEQLLSEGKAFYCAHTKEELEMEHKGQLDAKEPPRHICAHRNEGRPARQGGGEAGIIRLKNDLSGTISFLDVIRGDISVNAELLGDFSLARTVDTPLYNFTAVIDDHEMHISHVIRGEDHIPNTPKQLLIQQALGWKPPHYAHLPLLLGTDRSKLSKRHGATAVRDYKATGYIPEALVNFLALLGWNPGDMRELFTMQELIKEFSLEKVQKAGAIFNEEKLRWINQQYIMKVISFDDLLIQIKSFVSESTISPDTLKRMLQVEQPRMAKLSDILDMMPLYAEDPIYNAQLLSWKGTQDIASIAEHLSSVRNILCDTPEQDFIDKGKLQNAIEPYAAEKGKGDVLWPLRAALSGKKTSPGPFEIMYVIGKEATLRRIDKALELIEKWKM